MNIHEYIDKAAKFKAGPIVEDSKAKDAKVNLEMASRLKDLKQESTAINKPHTPYILG